MAEQRVNLNPGESQAVSFEVTAPADAGTYNVHVDELSGQFFVAEAEAEGFSLVYVNPKGPFLVGYEPATTSWVPRLYNLEDGVISTKEEGPWGTAIGKAVVLHPVNNTFLIDIWENPGGYIYGPYLVTLPSNHGSYTLNGQTLKITDNITGEVYQAIYMAVTKSKCYITGTIKSIQHLAEGTSSASYAVTIAVDSVALKAGYNNWGNFWLGRDIKIWGAVVIDYSAGMLQKVGKRVTVEAEIKPPGGANSYAPEGGFIWHWSAAGKPMNTKDYPDSDYVFGLNASPVKTGTFVYYGKNYNTGYFRFDVTGKPSSFAVIIRKYMYSYDIGWYWSNIKTTGPLNGYVHDCSGSFLHAQVWAHPDPERVVPSCYAESIGRYALEMDNWVKLYDKDYSTTNP